jgi:hypothetical protein
MKYFTPQLWEAFNTPRREAAFKTYDRRLVSYRNQLAELLPRLSSKARRFFREVCLLHDGTLARLEVGDSIADPHRGLGRDKINERRVSVRAFILSENGESLYTLQYTGVARVDLNCPGKVTLFPVGKHAHFGDWGYDELTATKDGLFRHEVLFASGSTFAVEFKKFSFHKQQIGS